MHAQRDARMELRQLKYFTRIVEIGSMSRAAETLFIAQSALSQQVANLEAEVGCVLLRRSSRGVAMTQAGERLYARAVRILAEVEDLKLHLRGELAAPRGKVTIGMPSSVTQLCTAPLMTRAWRDLPEVLPNIQEATSATLPELLLNGRFDLCVMFDEDLVKGIAAVPLFEESLFLVERRPAGARGAAACTVTIDALQGLRLAMTPPANNVRRLMDSACQLHHVRYVLAAEASSPQAILQAVRMGEVATVCPWSALAGWMDDPSLRVRRIVHPGLSRTLVLARAEHTPAGEAVEAVHGLLLQLLPTLGPQPPQRPRAPI